eukprot:scaffold31788_cov65-Phaeocystis_antarctica.AAC.1
MDASFWSSDFCCARARANMLRTPVSPGSSSAARRKSSSANARPLMWLGRSRWAWPRRKSALTLVGSASSTREAWEIVSR